MGLNIIKAQSSYPKIRLARHLGHCANTSQQKQSNNIGILFCGTCLVHIKKKKCKFSIPQLIHISIFYFSGTSNSFYFNHRKASDWNAELINLSDKNVPFKLH